MEFLQQCVELVQSGVELLQAGWVEIDSVQAAADFLGDVFQLYVAGIQSVGEFSHFRVDFSDVADAVAGIAQQLEDASLIVRKRMVGFIKC